MAENLCYQNVWNWKFTCHDKGWKTNPGKKLLIWPPASCTPSTNDTYINSVTTSFYRKLKQYYGFSYLQLGMIETLEICALDAGWQINEMQLFVDKPISAGIGNINYHVDNIYRHAASREHNLHGFFVDEPIHKPMGWLFNWSLCHFTYNTDDICVCAQRIWDHIWTIPSGFERDAITLNLVLLGRYLKEKLSWPRNEDAPVPNHPANLIVSEYDNTFNWGGFKTGTDGLEELKRLFSADCGLRQYIYQVGCDKYEDLWSQFINRKSQWRYFRNAGIRGDSVWINLKGDFMTFENPAGPPYEDLLAYANKIGINQINVVGVDEDFSSCSEFEYFIKIFLTAAEKSGWVYRDYPCSRWRELAGTKICAKYAISHDVNDCKYCSKDNPDDWIWIQQGGDIGW